MSDAALSLAAGFPEADHAAWTALVEKALKGADPASLVSRTADGIAIQPLYTANDGAPGLPGFTPFLRGARPDGNVRHGWDIRQRHEHPDPAAANTAILEDLERGVTSIVLRLDTAFAQGEDEPDGIMAYDAQDLAAVLDGVMLDVAPIRLEAPGRGVEAARAFLAVLAERGHPRHAVTADLGLDPLGAVALGRADPATALEAAVAAAGPLLADWPGLRLLHVDGELYHAAGASEAQELAAAIATGIAYLRAAEAAGLPPEETAPRLAFTLAADADLFLTIAKCRAARLLWAEVMAACGAPDVPMRLELRTASRMLTRRDPWVNMLRTTAACFAGVIGGAEAVTVTPFDAAVGEASRLGRRIARNIQLILMEESNLHRVIDPAGGSPYVESLTRELAGKAWPVVQAIEGEGGMLASLRQGVVQDAIARTYLARLDDLAHRRTPVTGVSTFPDLGEAPLAAEAPVPDAVVERARTRLGDRRPPARIAAPLHPMRLAQGFERLRDLADVAEAEAGARPRVFVAGLGPLARHAAEASFVRNALAAGGIAAVMSPPLADAAAAGEAFAQSGADIACLCGIGRKAPDAAAPVVQALLAGGAVALYAAGRPDPALEALGIDGFIHGGGNILGLLEDLHSLAMGMGEAA